MKNNYLIILLLTFFYLFNGSILFSDEFNFEATEIQVLENGNKLKAINGVKIISNDGLVITASEFDYDKLKLTLIATGNVNVVDSINNIVTQSNKVFYFKEKKIMFSKGETISEIGDKYIIKTSDITFDRNKMRLFSKNRTKFNDNYNNVLFLDDFKYSIKEKLVRGKEIKFISNTKDEYLIEDALIDLNLNEIAGKDIIINFDKSTFGNVKNEPRLKGNTITSNENESIISKGIFTTCQKRDKCPPWQMSAKEIHHDKSKKIINYKDAWLKIYDKPVLYFPKFFHPDPTVKRQSGFLMPKFSDSNILGASLDIPYFNVISESQDLTFKPRIYTDQNLILQSEYRAVTKNSSHIFDTSINRNNNSDKKNNSNDSKTHFFSNSIVNLGLSGFDESQIELNLQRTSNDTYLKLYKLNSPLIEDTTTLNSFLNFDASREDLSISSSIEVYEDLSKLNNDRYEFIYPNFDILKDFSLEKINDGNLSLNSKGYQKKFDTNSYEAVFINDLLYKSDPIFKANGLKNNYSILLKNVNSNSENSNKYKDEKEYEILSAFLFESSYDLKKEGTKYNNFFTPTVSMRYSPNNTKNMREDDKRIDVNNIFSLDRIGAEDTIEGGQSITLGTKYQKMDKSNNLLSSINLAKVFRDKVNEDLPIKSTIGNKSSDFVGNIKLIPNDIIDFDYNFSFDNNLSTSNYDSIKTKLTVNNFVTTFEYLEENNLIGSESFIANETSYNLNNDNSISFSTRKNKKTDLTEFYNLVYQYKNDCLVAAIEYNKEYYNDNDLKPEEEIFFSITIMPFSKTNSPNLNK